MQFEIGQEVDGYLIQGIIGRGGMGIVYRAEDVALERKVALKVINPSMTRDEAFVRRFQSEARTLARVNSPNIVAIHAFRKTEHGLFIVMEFVDGGDLAEVLQEGALSVSRALPIAKQLLRAFQDAHSAGVIHRDIKPPNIMISSVGEVKVTDFGLAKMSQADMTKTMTQGVMGTLYYMSPEQVRGEAVDQRSDLWAFGVVLYEMLTGARPFEAPYEASVMYAIMNEPVSFSERYRRELPDALQRIVLKALEKDREKRYVDATEMLVDLDAFESTFVDTTATRVMSGKGVKSSDKTRSIAPPRKPPSGRRTKLPSEVNSGGGKRNVLIAAIGVVAVLTVLAIWFFLGSGEPPPASTLSVNSTPPGAEVYLSGELIGTTPVDAFMLEGEADSVSVRIGLDGYVEVDTTLRPNLFHFIELRPAEVVSATDDGETTDEPEGGDEEPAPRPPPRGSVAVHAYPSGIALLDNEALPADESYSVPVGNHTISFRSDVYGRVDTTLYIASGATRRLDLYYESVLNISTGAVTAVVMVNGDFIGESPVFGHKLGPGEYRIRVEKVGYRAVPVDTVLTLRPRFGEQREIPLSFRLEQQ